MTKDLRAKFMKVYSNIPLGLRTREIVAVVDGESLTYSQIYWKLRDAEIADKALVKMETMKIL